MSLLCVQVSAEMKPLGLLYEDKQLELGESLGEGSFGVVYSGRLAVKGKALQVAAKTIKGVCVCECGYNCQQSKFDNYIPVH